MIVKQLLRYPIKSFGGESIESTDLLEGGMPFDRAYALIDTQPNRAGKPLTGREQRRLLAYKARAEDGEIHVRTPAGADFKLRDPALLAELEHDLGRPILLTRQPGPYHDAADLLVINAASLRALGAEFGKPLDLRRFRPNVILDAENATPFAESSWAGGRFLLGDALLEADYQCERCVMTTIDPDTLEMEPGVLRLIVERHAKDFGVYCRVVRGATIRVGDAWRPALEAEGAA